MDHLSRTSTCFRAAALLLGLSVAARSARANAQHATWERVEVGVGEALTALAVDAVDPRRVFVGAPGAIYVSHDGGWSWKRHALCGADRAEPQRLAGNDPSPADRLADAYADERERALEEARETVAHELSFEEDDFVSRSDPAVDELARQAVDGERGEIQRKARRMLAGHDAPADRNRAAATCERAAVQRIVPAPGGRVFVATNRGLFVLQGQVVRLMPLGSGSGIDDVRAVAISRTSPHRMYAGTAGGLLASDDGGDTWRLSTALPPAAAVTVAIDPTDAQHLVVATDRGVFESIDGGRDFVALTLPVRTFRRTQLAAGSRTVFVATEHDLYRWIAGKAEPVLTSGGAPILLARSADGILVATDRGLVASVDGGVTFQWLSRNPDDETIRALAVSPRRSTAWALTNGGLYVRRWGPKRPAWRPLVERAPSLASTLAMAVHAASLDSAPARGWSARAALSAFAPRILVRFGRTDSILPAVDDGSFFGTDALVVAPCQTTFLVLLSWDTSRWSLNPETLAATRAAQLVARRRAWLSQRVEAVYRKRRRLAARLAAAPPRDPLAFARATLRLDELTGELDAWTHGAFSHARDVAQGTRP